MNRPNFDNLFRLFCHLEFEPLEISVSDNDVVSQSSGTEKGVAEFDGLADISWDGKTYKFLFELKSRANPKSLDTSIYQMRKWASLLTTNQQERQIHLLIVAPFLNEEALKKLADSGVSGLDLSGNGVITVPGELFVYRSGAKNKFPSNAPIKNVFRGVSSIVARVFFSKPEFSSATELLDEIIVRGGSTTPATVSKVLKSLEEELLISREGRIRTIDQSRLLRNLSENYRKPEAFRRYIGKAENLDATFARISSASDECGFLFAAADPQRYAVLTSTSDLTTVYTTNLDAVLEIGENISEQERFANLEILEIADQTLFFDRRKSDSSGYYITSPLQDYLELSAGGKREREIAEQIEDGLLNFRY